MSKNSTENELDRYIIKTVGEKKPQTVRQLVNLIKQTYTIPEQQILDQILRLEEAGKINLKPPQTQTQETLAAYLRSGQAAWYWATLIVAAATVLVVFTVPEDASPLVYARYTLGSIFVLWLPGYTFMKALFPKQHPTKTTEKNMDTIERVALSIGMSLALVPIIGLLLNYSPWGIRLTPITLSLTALTVTFATAAVIREHQTTETQQTANP